MKICSKCKEIKEHNMFGLSKETKSGLQSWCKECKSKAKRCSHRTKFGLISHIYQGQRERSIARGHQLPSYTRDDLYNWCINQNIFNTVFSEWESSNFDKTNVPSIDRIDDHKGYSFDNIQILRWNEHLKKTHKTNKNATGSRNYVAVEQYDKNGVFIKTFNSVLIASRDTNIVQQNIFKVINGKRKTAGGFIWKKKYEDDGYNKKVDK